MKTKKQFFFMRAAMSLLVMLCSLGAWADDSGSCGTNVTYSYVESTHTLTISGSGAMADYEYSSQLPWRSYANAITTVVIEDGVTSIGNYAFSGCSGLTSVEIPTNVTSIGDYAFFECTGLTTVTFDGTPTLVSIGGSAFWGSGLTTVTIPASVTSIGNNAFQNCGSLATMTVAGENKVYDSRNGCNAIIEKNTNTLIAGCINSTIPASVTSIGDEAFNCCSGLTSVTIPAGVTSIGNYAFNSCSGLTSVTIPASVTSIGNYAFDCCSGLTSVTIPASVTSIGEGVFEYCKNLATITVEDGNTVYNSRNGCNAIIETSSNKLIAGCKNTTIPASVTSIGNYAFSGCSGLTSVEIPTNVTSIGDNAFSGCTGLISVTIPASVTSIGVGAFIFCGQLTSVLVNATTPPTLGDYAFDSNASGRKIYVPTASVESYKSDWSTYRNDIMAFTTERSGSCGTDVTWKLTGIPDNYTLTISGSGAINDRPWTGYANGIKTVVIGSGVTSIGDNAFFGCSGLTSIEIPASVTSIGKYAFSGCSGLATVTVYAPSCTLGSNAFSACGNLKNIYVFSDLVDDYKAAWSAYESKITAMTPVASGTCGKETPEDVTWRLEGEAGHYRLIISGTGEMADYIYLNTRPWHNYSENIKTIVIENGVTSIGECAFCECNGLTSISIPASVTSIGPSAFEGCSALTSIEIPASVTSIGNYAFGYCSALTSIEIPASVTTIGEEAFNNTALTSIEIPASVTSIGNGAFIDCEKLTSITVAEGNANYSNDTNGALFNKEKTTLIKYPEGNDADSYKIPASVTSIGEKAFKGCGDLETVTLPDNVTSIGNEAFKDCGGLQSIEIPAKVTSIGNSAFQACGSLTTVNILANVTSIGDNAFMECSNLQSIEIHANVTSIGNYAFNVCSSLASVTLNNNPTIGEEAFFYNTTVTMNLAAAEVEGAHWTTFYNNYGNFQADENTEVYKGAVSGSELVLTAISDKIVNAGNAVILKSTGNPVMTLKADNSTGDYSDNELKGLSVRTLASDVKTNYSANSLYVMGNKSNKFGFHKYTGTYMPANKAFLALGSGSSAPLRMVIDDDEETTGIASMADGIDNMSDEWYTLDGRKLNGKPTTKGLYIVKGKKVMIK